MNSCGSHRLSPTGNDHAVTATFFIPNAWPVINPGAAGSFGGMETRAWTFAVALAQIGQFACRVVVDTRLPIRKRFRQGVTVVPVVEPLREVRRAVSRHSLVTPSFPWIRIQRWNWSLLWQIPLLAVARPFHRALEPGLACDSIIREPGDVFCVFGTSAYSASVIRSAREKGVRSILFLAWDGELDDSYITHPELPSINGCSRGLCADCIREADLIVAQNQYQSDMLRKNYGRTCVLIENPIDLSFWTPARPQADSPRGPSSVKPYGLWIGRADRTHKHPERLFELAARCPELSFVMVLNGGESDIAAELHRDAPSNVRIRGPVPATQMPSMFLNAFATVSTADVEGTPNVFLQSLAMGVPVVTLSAASDLIAASRGGVCCNGNLETMQSTLQGLQADAACQGVDMKYARQFLQEHHSAPAQAFKLASAISDLAGSRS